MGNTVPVFWTLIHLSALISLNPSRFGGNHVYRLLLTWNYATFIPFVVFVFLSEYEAIISMNNLNRTDVLKEVWCVFCRCTDFKIVFGWDLLYVLLLQRSALLWCHLRLKAWRLNTSLRFWVPRTRMERMSFWGWVSTSHEKPTVESGGWR
jgi:hypothetical protein